MSEEKVIFRFIDIRIMTKNLNPIGNENPTDFNYTIQAGIRIHSEKEAIIIEVIASITNVTKTYIFAEFNVWCVFHINDFNNKIIKNAEGFFVIPAELELTLKPVSISTTRGIIYKELAGTYLQQAIMPVVFMNDFRVEESQNSLLENILE